MALTPIEIRAILETANWWDESERGRAGVGLTPSSVVAQLRGVPLGCTADGLYRVVGASRRDELVDCLALQDTLEAFGCQRFSEYYALLLEEGPLSLSRLPGVH